MNISELRRRQFVYDFARRSFRDVADADYLLARMAFRKGLDVQFLSLAHQAVEKYLKAILLFNRRPTIRIRHSIETALRLIRDLPFEIRIPDDVVPFLEGLDRYSDRYFEESYGVSGRKLGWLDRSVWHIRRYCADWTRVDRTDDDTYTETLDVELDYLHDPRWEKEPYRFRLPSAGILEDILAGKRAELHEDLVWNNMY